MRFERVGDSFPQIVYIQKSCIHDDDKVFQTVV